MKKYAILTDSSCDIDDKTAQELGIFVLRMPITIDEKEYTEGVDIDLNGIKKAMSDGKVVKTSQARLGALIKMYDSLLEEYDEIIHIPLSSGLSGMYETSLIQSKTYEGRITVIDAKCVCYPLTKLCLDVKEMIGEGKTASEIKDIIENTPSIMEAIIIPSDLNYLKRGGRITLAAAALANLLKIVPVLSLKEGVIDVFDKVRTWKKAIHKGIDEAVNVDDPSQYYWMVIADGFDDMVEEVKQELEKRTHQQVEVHQFGAVILSHTGPGVVALKKKKKIKKVLDN